MVKIGNGIIERFLRKVKQATKSPRKRAIKRLTSARSRSVLNTVEIESFFLFAACYANISAERTFLLLLNISRRHLQRSLCEIMKIACTNVDSE
jgi:hypothetical protein